MTRGPMPATQRAAISAGHARNRAGNSLLYVADVGDDVIKIGCSADPARRLLSWGKRPRRMVTVKGGYAGERELHQQLKAYRCGCGHEWYDAAVLNHPAVIAVFGGFAEEGRTA